MARSLRLGLAFASVAVLAMNIYWQNRQKWRFLPTVIYLSSPDEARKIAEAILHERVTTHRPTLKPHNCKDRMPVAYHLQGRLARLAPTDCPPLARPACVPTARLNWPAAARPACVPIAQRRARQGTSRGTSQGTHKPGPARVSPRAVAALWANPVQMAGPAAGPVGVPEKGSYRVDRPFIAFLYDLSDLNRSNSVELSVQLTAIDYD
ncbi:hypothetical protein B0H67DRAFT_558777 [Lasiosphaeris hirsuta]|uniref:Uncharacterized protein n=1 Tax=Lasiosphaeris hirsuta TaxID=260670 RepID=A0AA40DFN3_9PEZI|nr:hypothetical protein B0H67DRAFT_558777 [Lasiosphaeris hirsuta]